MCGTRALGSPRAPWGVCLGEQAYQARGIPLVVLPPSPKRNTRVEYVHGTCWRAFDAVRQVAAQRKQTRVQWCQWQALYNRLRPHASLGV